MGAVNLFPLQQPEDITIQMRINVKGTYYDLKHVFREPTAEDKKKYQRLLSQTELVGRERRIRLDYGAAAESLWNNCIKSVEGYDTAGVEDWKSRIPLEHKQWAVEALLSEVGIPEEIEKNLSWTSAKP